MRKSGRKAAFAAQRRQETSARRDKSLGSKRIFGVIAITRRGTGYLSFDQTKGKQLKDIEVGTDDLCGALNGDTVEVELIGTFPRPTGRVKRIVQRVKKEFVGVVTEHGLVQPDDVRFYTHIRVGEPTKISAMVGKKVLVRLTHFDGREAHGEIVEELGRAGEHTTEMNAIVREHGFATRFPPEAAAEAATMEQEHAQTIATELARRKDCRNIQTFTIDPADAKDFDDALSIREIASNEYEIGIHIADVTHFVKPGMAIEEEARRRGTSVYLVNITIPMLPHQLSNNICSLREGEDRLAFSVIVRMGRDGTVRSREFTKTVIRSDKRFTYEEAQNVLDTGEGPFAKDLKILWTLAQKLRARREGAGAIDFGDHEVKFELDERGKPVRIVRKERIETNLLIEEFMLLANREVATHISDLAKKVPEKNLVFLYRIHDLPKDDRIEELATFVRAVGYDFGKKKKRPSARDIKELLKQIAGKPEEHLIRTATLRSMAKAIYSTKNIGHFGLAFRHYTHFTSPIRRYPDMLVHRILESHLNGRPITRKEYTDLEKRCVAASEAEAKAVDAERDSIRYKQVEYMRERIGQEFDAVISGVTEWGLYVEEKETAAEGLVHVRALGDDFYNYVPRQYALVGQKTKKKYALGDRVRVRLVGADLTARTMDFELVGAAS